MAGCRRLFCGVGAPTLKSSALLSVSVRAVRAADVVLLVARRRRGLTNDRTAVADEVDDAAVGGTVGGRLAGQRRTWC